MKTCDEKVKTFEFVCPVHLIFFVSWFLVDRSQKIGRSLPKDQNISSQIKFLIGKSTKISSVKTGFEGLKKVNKLDGRSFGSYLPKTKRGKYEMNGTQISKTATKIGTDSSFILGDGI